MGLKDIIQHHLDSIRRGSKWMRQQGLIRCSPISMHGRLHCMDLERLYVG